MSRYFFDIHAEDLSYWDDDGEECEDRDAIERCAMDRLSARLIGVQGGKHLPLATAFVRDDAGIHVLTAILGSRTGLRLSWAKAGSTVEDHHALG